MTKGTTKKIRSEYTDESPGPSDMKIDELAVQEVSTTPETSTDEEGTTVEGSVDSNVINYENFEQVRVKKNNIRRRKISNIKSTPQEISVKNKFDILSNKDDNKDETEEKETTTKLFPPIVVRTGMTFKAFISEVQTFIKQGNATNYKIGWGTFSIYTSTIEDFKTVQEKLKDKKYEFHTYSPKEERNKRLVIKGISCEFTTTEVEEELIKLGLEIIKVSNIFKAKNTPSNMFLVNFPKSVQLNTVLKSNKFQYICYQKVKWCKYTPQINNSVQCYRCQGFGHSSSNCNYPQRCVKCTTIHETGKCPKTLEEKPKCSNCQGEHPANYRQCPHFVNYVSKLEVNKSKIPIKKYINTRPTAFTTPNISYSNITKSNNMTQFPLLTQSKNINTAQKSNNSNINIPQQTIQTQSQTQTVLPTNEINFNFEEEVNRLFKCSIEELGTLLDEFLPKLYKSTSNSAKQIQIINFIAQFK